MSYLEVFSLTLLHSVTHGRRRWKVYLSLLLSCNSAFLFLSFSPPLSSLHCTLYTHYTHTYTYAHTYNWLAPLLQGAYRAMTLVGSARLCTASRCWSVLVRLERFLLERVLLSSCLSYSSSVCQRFGRRHSVYQKRARARDERNWAEKSVIRHCNLIIRSVDASRKSRLDLFDRCDYGNLSIEASLTELRFFIFFIVLWLWCFDGRLHFEEEVTL